MFGSHVRVLGVTSSSVVASSVAYIRIPFRDCHSKVKHIAQLEVD